MKRLSILVIGVFLLFSGTTFASSDHLQFTFQFHCEDSDPTCVPDIPEEQEEFVVSHFTGEPMLIDLVIDNPKREMVTSVHAKLKFDSKTLLVKDINIEDSDFTFPEPFSNTIDENEGTVNIGLSLTGGSKSNEKFHVATLTLQPLTSGASLKFINYQHTELGDTGIFFTSGITAENRLKEEPKPLIFGIPSQNSTVPPVGGAVLPRVDIGGSQTGGVIAPIKNGSALEQPVGLRIQTDDQGNVRLIWPINEDPNIAGYYLYYSQKSGYYLRRRDVGKTNFALFPNLPSGEKYFFAIKAYDQIDQESEYSNEVFVTVGLPGSESHGFTGDPNAQKIDHSDTSAITENKTPKDIDMENADKTVDSGPEHILFFMIISMGLALFGYAFRRK